MKSTSFVIAFALILNARFLAALSKGVSHTKLVPDSNTKLCRNFVTAPLLFFSLPIRCNALCPPLTSSFLTSSVSVEGTVSVPRPPPPWIVGWDRIPIEVETCPSPSLHGDGESIGPPLGLFPSPGFGLLPRAFLACPLSHVLPRPNRWEL